DIADVTLRRKIPDVATFHDLLIPIFRSGKLVYQRPSIHEIRNVAASELKHFYAGIKRLLNPHIYPVGLDENLHHLKAELVNQARADSVLPVMDIEL
ncbi:MAG: hypothetical protein JO076_09570, partial [Verrucomicrobia bacterium]|nr:hypothetical protein [Verrucomicrobiota bacterium]